MRQEIACSAQNQAENFYNGNVMLHLADALNRFSKSNVIAVLKLENFNEDWKMIQAVFFDRDGVLNEEVGYLWKVEEFIWINGARDAIKLCNEHGILTVVVTNQSGIARGLYTAQDVEIIHAFMQRSLAEVGAHIDAFYYCPHHPEGKVEEFRIVCDCRKPKPGMILRACKELNINPAQAILFGDSKRDIEAAEAAGLRKGIPFFYGNLFDAVKTELENL